MPTWCRSLLLPGILNLISPPPCTHPHLIYRLLGVSCSPSLFLFHHFTPVQNPHLMFYLRPPSLPVVSSSALLHLHHFLQLRHPLSFLYSTGSCHLFLSPCMLFSLRAPFLIATTPLSSWHGGPTWALLFFSFQPSFSVARAF